MKTLILLLGLIVTLLFGCNTFTAGVGVPSSLVSIGHSTDEDYYRIASFADRNGPWEYSLAQHHYKINDEKFSNVSVGGKYYIEKTWSWSYVELGVGVRLTETDSRNPWLANSHLLADISCGVGLRANLDSWEIKGGYFFQHLSAPWRDDQGMNFDGVQVALEYKF